MDKEQVTKIFADMLNGEDDPKIDQFYQNVEVDYRTGNTAIVTYTSPKKTISQYIITVKDVAKNIKP